MVALAAGITLPLPCTTTADITTTAGIIIMTDTTTADGSSLAQPRLAVSSVESSVAADVEPNQAGRWDG
ncbi:MAG: hypothetical protein MJ240_13825 [Kiritimatiellae bacterium]|nr:hypothetical protein [Kiritimatiellia bacterium]